MVMLIPLAVLSVGAIAAGFVFHEQFVGPENAEFWRGAIFNAPTNQVLEHAHHSPQSVIWAPLIATIIGFARRGLGLSDQGRAWARASRPTAARCTPSSTTSGSSTSSTEATFVRAAKFLGDVFWKVGDQKIIDGFGPNGVSAVDRRRRQAGGQDPDRLRLPLRLRHVAWDRRARGATASGSCRTGGDRKDDRHPQPAPPSPR